VYGLIHATVERVRGRRRQFELPVEEWDERADGTQVRAIRRDAVGDEGARTWRTREDRFAEVYQVQNNRCNVPSVSVAVRGLKASDTIISRLYGASV
jgi:hypothetical protein